MISSLKKQSLIAGGDYHIFTPIVNVNRSPEEIYVTDSQ